MNVIRKALVVVGLMVVAGCASYYQVTDPTTGKSYFTTSSEISQSDSGATSFIDARTGNKVTLQNSEIAKITQQQYENGKNGVTPATQP
jgi:hypothetical protein